MVYFSQFGEDQILARIFADKPTGFCIEVGANDGINDSTTYYFERVGWDCLLIEPNPDLCMRIRETRSAKLVQCAASDSTGEVVLFIAEGASRAHGVSSMHGGRRAQERINAYGFSSREVRVSTRKLDDILKELQINQPIDFVSIDVEGHELAVLQGFSLTHWRPSILLIEDNEKYQNPAVRSYLRTQGYFPFRRTGVNDWYARAENKSLVNWRSRSVYLLGQRQARAKEFLKKIPGLKLLWGVLKKLRGH